MKANPVTAAVTTTGLSSTWGFLNSSIKFKRLAHFSIYIKLCFIVLFLCFVCGLHHHYTLMTPSSTSPKTISASTRSTLPICGKSEVIIIISPKSAQTFSYNIDGSYMSLSTHSLSPFWPLPLLPTVCEPQFQKCLLPPQKHCWPPPYCVLHHCQSSHPCLHHVYTHRPQGFLTVKGLFFSLTLSLQCAHEVLFSFFGLCFIYIAMLFCSCQVSRDFTVMNWHFK